MRRLATLAAAVLTVTSCGGGGSTPAAPAAPTPAPPAPTTPVNTWSAAGRVVTMGSGQGIGGATVTPGWSLAPVTADGDGSYMLGDVANPPSTPYPVSVSATGMLTRDTWINWARGPRTGVDIDLISIAAPFSMDFYRQFVRGTYDQSGAPWPVLRLKDQPRFYVRTLDQDGKGFDTYVIPGIVDAITRAVPAFTGGRFNAAIETGPDVRPPTAGWINVDIRHDPAAQDICGQARIGADPGEITLVEDLCGCTKVPGLLVMHEVGHALGFFHVPDKNAVMYPFISGSCPKSGVMSAAELFHANIAYARPRGNTDPDKDPGNGATALREQRPLVIVDRR